MLDRMLTVYKFIVKKIIIVTLLSMSLSSCSFRNKKDPFEGVNRGIFVINRTLDRAFLKPAACFYQRCFPQFVQRRINNFFLNIAEIPTSINDLLQCDCPNFAKDASRFLLNTTWGIGGLFDVAAMANRCRHFNDFGITLGKWGYKDSIYIVLPFFGPSTVRDTIGRALNYGVSPWPYIRPQSICSGFYVAFAVDARAYYLKMEPAIDEAAVDEYVFFREAYLQRRAVEIRGVCATAEPVLLEEPPE